MPKIKYVGLKQDGETAFSRMEGAPAIWMQGDSYEVPDNVAKLMLEHPMVFALDDAPVAVVEPVVKAKRAKKAVEHVEEPVEQSE